MTARARESAARREDRRVRDHASTAAWSHAARASLQEARRRREQPPAPPPLGWPERLLLVTGGILAVWATLLTIQIILACVT